MVRFLLWLIVGIGLTATALADTPASDETQAIRDVLEGRFQWTAGPALIGPAPATDQSVAIKDPSLVFHDGRWHMFATIKTSKLTNMESLSFTDWPVADAAPRHVITLDKTYHCAPEVVYFRPQRKWYLIYQWADETPGTGFFGPAYSTMNDPGQPETLTRPKMLFPKKPENVEHWIDFWVICDDTHAYLFFTGDDGLFWRSRTALADFPSGWSRPEIIMRDKTNELFEASCTYRLKGRDRYLTLIEAIGPADRRYFKAYLADRLDAPWRPLAATWDHPFASIENVKFTPGVVAWTDSISHGELLRDGNDETLTVDPAHLRFVFQGCSAKDREGKSYGQFPWRLGILEPAK